MKHLSFFSLQSQRAALWATVVAVAGLSCGPVNAAAAAQPVAAAASHVDKRSENNRLRRKCTDDAQAQGLTGDALKLQVQKCLSGK
ncbi:MAG: hypothetical protein RIQ60_1948 [Pseudomonadota bacterium]|jgi:hypothetical protein